MHREKANSQKNRLRTKIASVLVKLVLLFFAVIALFPLAWMLISSIKPTRELFSVPPTVIVKNPTLDS